MLGSYSFIAAVNGNGDEPIEPIPPLLWGPMGELAYRYNPELLGSAVLGDIIVLVGREQATGLWASTDGGRTFTPPMLTGYVGGIRSVVTDGAWWYTDYNTIRRTQTPEVENSWVTVHDVFAGASRAELACSPEGNVVVFNPNGKMATFDTISWLDYSFENLPANPPLDPSVYRFEVTSLTHVINDVWVAVDGAGHALYTDDMFETYTVLERYLNSGAADEGSSFFGASGVSANSTGLVVAVFVGGYVAYSISNGEEGSWLPLTRGVGMLGYPTLTAVLVTEEGHIVFGASDGQATYTHTLNLNTFNTLPTDLNSGATNNAISSLATDGVKIVSTSNTTAGTFSAISPPLA